MKLDDIKVGMTLYYARPHYINADDSLAIPSGWYDVERITAPRVYIKGLSSLKVYTGFTYAEHLHTSFNTVKRIEPEEDRLKVNSHYAKGTTLDPWEIMRQKFTPEEFRGYMKGNILKYLMRFEHKSTPLQDLRKIEDHVKELIKQYESGGN